MKETSRSAQIEALKNLKEELLEVNNTTPSVNYADFYGTADDKNVENSFYSSSNNSDGISAPKIPTMKLPGAAKDMYKDMPRNGFVNVCLLAFLTFFFQLFFFVVSYIVFK